MKASDNAKTTELRRREAPLLRGLVFGVANVFRFCGVKGEVGYGSNQPVNAKRDDREEDIGRCSAGISLGLQSAVVDDQTTDPSKEKRQKKTRQIFIFHCIDLLFQKSATAAASNIFDNFIVIYSVRIVNTV